MTQSREENTSPETDDHEEMQMTEFPEKKFSNNSFNEVQ